MSEHAAERTEADVAEAGAYAIDRCPTARGHGVAEARAVRYRYYVVVGGEHPGVHVTDDYAASVHRVVDDLRGTWVYGR